MQLSEALAMVRSGRRAILFLGAGFANQAQNLADEPTPSSRQLVKRMLTSLTIDGDADTPLSFAIDQMREKYPPTHAYDFLTRQLTVKDATLEQIRILSLPWHRIYTTNIDDIGIRHSNRPCRDAASDTSPADSGDFVYLHGCLANCTPNNYYQKVKMGEQLYVAGSHSNSQYHNLLLQDLHESDCVFVVGYSMGDPDLARLFYSSPQLINKCFVFSGNTAPLDHHRIGLIGNDTKQTSTQFLAAHDALPISSAPTYSAQISVDLGTHDTKDVSQTARQNLLIYGRFDRNIARSSWSKPSEPLYVVGRDVAQDIASINGPCTVIVHSHLGNGKTLILEYARYICSTSSKPTFVVDSTADADRLRDLLTELPIGSIAFFEGSIFHVSKVQDIVADRSLLLCATSRTTTMRVASREIYSQNKSSVRVFDCNQLTEGELVDFHDLIDTMGFWPSSLQGKTPEQRFQALKSQYESSTCAIVLAIFENDEIRNQVTEVWETSAHSVSPIQDHFIVSSYMNMIDVDAPPYLVNQFQSGPYSTQKSLENDILSVNFAGVVSFSSSIVGEFVFQNLVEKEAMIGAVVRFSNFIDGHYAQRRYQWIVRRLLRFWNLRRLLNSTTLPEQVFDRASYIPSVASDPLFWVQYSISKMENGEFFPARRFVATAYDKAKERGSSFDTYQIDTHAARLVVRSLLDEGLYEGFASDLNRAVASLRGVAERRPDDLYHVSVAVTMLLASNIKFSFEMSEREYRTLVSNLIAIGNRLEAVSETDFSFAPERQALDLIRALRN